MASIYKSKDELLGELISHPNLTFRPKGKPNTIQERFKDDPKRLDLLRKYGINIWDADDPENVRASAAASSCLDIECPMGQRCRQIGGGLSAKVECYKPTNNLRGGKVLDVNPIYAKATETLDSLMQMALGGGKRTIIPKNKDFKPKLELIEDYQGGSRKSKKDDDEEEEEEDTNKPVTSPIKSPTGTTTPPVTPVATTTGGGSSKALEWIKANPPFAIIIAGLLLYVVMKGGR